MTDESYLERVMAQIIKDEGLPTPIREYRVLEPRKWRGDFVWLEPKVLLEVEGGIWTGGRHTRGQGFVKDCEKYNSCALAGFLVLRVTKEHIWNGKALEWLKLALDTDSEQ